MAAPERAELLKESKAFIESEELMRLATSFPGWVPINPLTGKGPPDWKTALLVLLGLFPVVMLELRFLSPVLKGLGLHASLATFIGNALSVAATSFIAMPLFVRWFGWWLFPADTSTGAQRRKASPFLSFFSRLKSPRFWQRPDPGELKHDEFENPRSQASRPVVAVRIQPFAIGTPTEEALAANRRKLRKRANSVLRRRIPWSRRRADLDTHE